MDLKVKHKTIELVDKNIAENLWGYKQRVTGIGKEFLDLRPKSTIYKTKI